MSYSTVAYERWESNLLLRKLHNGLYKRQQSGMKTSNMLEKQIARFTLEKNGDFPVENNLGSDFRASSWIRSRTIFSLLYFLNRPMSLEEICCSNPFSFLFFSALDSNGFAAAGSLHEFQKISRQQSENRPSELIKQPCSI